MAEDQLITSPGKCKYCGVAIPEGRKTKCSFRCRDKWRRENCKKEQVCNGCGIVFTAFKKQPYCSKECWSVVQKGKSHPSREIKHQCQRCGIEFKPKAARRTTYCSRECAFAHRKAMAKSPILDDGPYVLAYCQCCGKEMVIRQPLLGVKIYCSKDCAIIWQKYMKRLNYVPKEKFRRKCVMCERPFMTSHRHKRTCTNLCSDEYRRIRDQDSERKRQLRLLNVTVVPYSKLEIFKRDNWTCYICLRSVSRRHPRHHPRKATIDHVIPIAKGGDDTPWNVKCCCLRCNSMKGDDILNAV